MWVIVKSWVKWHRCEYQRGTASGNARVSAGLTGSPPVKDSVCWSVEILASFPKARVFRVLDTAMCDCRDFLENRLLQKEREGGEHGWNCKSENQTQDRILHLPQLKVFSLGY